MENVQSFKNFLILWLTQGLSRLGSSLTPYALMLWVYGASGSALAASLLTVSSYIPYILFSLPVGALTDRMAKKPLMMAADSFAALGTFTVLILFLSGRLELWHICLMNAFTGLAQTFQAPASEVAVTLVTPKEYYQKASGLNSLSYSVINMASPIIATTLYLLGGLPLVIMVDLGTFAIAFLSLAFLVRIPEDRKLSTPLPVWAGVRSALAYLKVERGILEVILFLASINLIASIHNAALPAMVLEQAGKAVLATLQAVAGAAMLLGGLIAAACPEPRNRVRVITASLFISMSTENFMLAFSRSPFIWYLGAALGWLCIPVMNTNLDALMRSKIPTELQGRVYAARNVLQFFTIPVGYLLGGVLVDSLFEPFMASCEDSTLHAIFGYGKGSGAALLFAFIGVLGVLTCVVFSRMKAMRHLG